MKSTRLLLLLLVSILVASPMSAQPDPLQGLDADIRQSMAELLEVLGPELYGLTSARDERPQRRVDLDLCLEEP